MRILTILSTFAFWGTLTLAPPYAANILARNMGYRAGRYRSAAYCIAKPLTYVLYFLSKGKIKAAINFMAYRIDGLFDVYRLPPSRKSLSAKSEEFRFLSAKN